MTFEAPPQVPLLARPGYWAVAATAAAVLGVITLMLWPRPKPQSAVRVRNASSITLHDVVVEKASYGDVAPGESTGYKSWGPAYPHPRVAFEVGGMKLHHIPIDHFSEHSLGVGRFTYVVTVAAPRSEEDFSVEAVKE